MVLTISVIKLAIGILLFMFANIIAGSYQAWAEGKFDKATMEKGIKKALIILLGFGVVYGAGMLNPDVLVMDIDGTKVNIMTAIYSGALLAFVAYGKQAIEKLFKIVMSNVDNKSE